MIILEYKLEATEEGSIKPAWVEDGGYWYDNGKLIGVTQDTPNFYIPSTVLRLTPTELEARQLAIHAVTPMIHSTSNNPEERRTEMTVAEVKAAVQEWVAIKQG